ncbi:hypothetical protein [Micromonospora sp. KC213]|uniref:hypothetical protein n=1 Tax=Micromonospora sp. KC213 TaxID=2530378 RepID=UPI001FB69E24|nr:hypothetical protein [Micromonospora sp. KC213]
MRRIGPGPSGGATTRTARHRKRRRRRALASLTALTCLAALVSYLNVGGDRALPAEERTPSPGAPTVAGRPTGLPAEVTEAGVASPGLRPRQRTPSPTPTAAPTTKPVPAGPVLTVAEAEVPATVDLTALGGRDWVHWGLHGPDSEVRKRGGSLEIRDEGGRGTRASIDTNPESFRWRDGTPVAAVGAAMTSVYTCGVGNGFSLAVAGSGQLRTVRLFVGVWMARGRLDVRLSTGGPTRTVRLEDPHTSHTVQWVVRFRVPPGEKLLMSWVVERTFNSDCGNVGLQAVALR